MLWETRGQLVNVQLKFYSILVHFCGFTVAFTVCWCTSCTISIALIKYHNILGVTTTTVTIFTALLTAIAVFDFYGTSTEVGRTIKQEIGPLLCRHHLIILQYSFSFPFESRHLRNATEASTLAGENVFGSLRSDMMLSRIVLYSTRNDSNTTQANFLLTRDIFYRLIK